MTFRTFQVVLRLGAPLHVGWRRLGNLWQVRPYILAHQLLAALAARCAEWGMGGETGSGSTPYARKLDWFKENIRATYLFPTLEKDPEKCYLPYFETPGKVTWLKAEDTQSGRSKLSREEFEYIFLDAQMRTALDYNSSTAREGSLHCMEYVRPWTRETEINGEEKSRPVYFAGYLFLSAEAVEKLEETADEKLGKIKDEPGAPVDKKIECILRRLFHCLQVGGERKYGWGLLLASENSVKEQEKQQPSDENSSKIFGGYIASVSTANGRVNGHIELNVKVKKDEPLLAHVDTDIENAGKKISGPVEVLVRRSTTDGRHYSKNVSLNSCYLPGSRCKNENAENTFKITPEGFWAHA